MGKARRAHVTILRQDASAFLLGSRVENAPVRHILAMERADLHELQDFARVQADGSILYPAPEEEG